MRNAASETSDQSSSNHAANLWRKGGKGREEVWSVPLGSGRPPLLTLVCKRGGRPPSAFRLLPCPCGPGACTPARCDRVGLPILMVVRIKIEEPAAASQTRSTVILLHSSTSEKIKRRRPEGPVLGESCDSWLP